MTDKAEVKRLKGELEACHRAWMNMGEKLTVATEELARLHQEISKTAENHARQLVANAKLLAEARQEVLNARKTYRSERIPTAMKRLAGE